MGFIQNQNMTSGSSQTEDTIWESTTQPSAVKNTVVVLGVLTFALQLCLVLLFVLRCWRLDNRVQEALKHTDSVNKLNKLPYFYLYKQPTCLFSHDAAGASPPTRLTTEEEKYECATDSLLTPSTPWDLVQA